jgi:hypothetical protein
MRCPGSRTLNWSGRDEGRQVVLFIVHIFDAEIDIDDRLGLKAGYRCRTDMIDTYRLGPESGDDLRALHRESLRPSRV